MKNFLNTMLATAAVFSVVSAASAATTNVTGFYVGASAGVANTTADYKATAGGKMVNDAGVTVSAIDSETRRLKANAGKSAALFGLMAGYNYQSGSAVFGAEIYGGFDTTKLNVFNDNDSGNSTEAALWRTSLKRQRFFGFAPRIGYMVTPNALVYAKLALEVGKWTAQVDPNLATINNPNNTVLLGMAPADIKKAQDASSVTVKASKGGLAFAPGLGVELFMTKNVFIRGEYSYLFGPTVKMTQATTAFNKFIWNGETADHSIKIRQHAVKFAIGYKF